MINRVVLVGRMVRDPELRRTGNGTPVTSFTLAVNRTFTDANGERQADFIPCVIWNKGAENTERYCSKGSLVGVDGRLQSRTYQDNNGNNRTVIELICDSVQFLDTKNAQNNAQGANNQNANKYSNQNKNVPQSNFGGFDTFAEFDNSVDTFDIMDEDIPF